MSVPSLYSIARAALEEIWQHDHGYEDHDDQVSLALKVGLIVGECSGGPVDKLFERLEREILIREHEQDSANDDNPM